MTTRSTSSTSHSSSATIETRCWASTSSGLRGITVSSISPSRIRFATTAHSSRSARNLGKIRPLETSLSWWPARPMRCRPRETDFGDSTWITRSSAPMSIPSSSELVATRQGSLPDLSSSSTTSRSSWASEPWWARAISSNGAASRRSSLASLRASRAVVLGRRKLLAAALVVELVEALGEPFGAAAVVDEDDRRGVLADELQQLRVDRRPDRARVGGGVERGFERARVDPVGREHRAALTRPPPEASRGGGRTPGSVMSSTGTTISQVQVLADPGVDDLAFALRADEELGDPLERALSRREADPLRLGIALAVTRCERRSSVSARWEPRLDWATAWISSTITASTPVRISRTCEVIIRYSDSGVVIRMSGGLRFIAWRSFCGVSPVRRPTETSAPMPFSGARRLRSTS